jgi:type IV pilus assembly protein PilE
MAGFTLLELMIVVVVIGIMAAVAYPSYQDAVLKGRRAEARAALAEFMQQQERYMTQQGAYKTVSLGDTGTPFKTWSGDSGATGASYLMKAEACQAGMALGLCVRLTAVPQRADPIGDLWITSTGEKGCTDSNKGVCWK